MVSALYVPLRTKRGDSGAGAEELSSDLWGKRMCRHEATHAALVESGLLNGRGLEYEV